jgi:PKD repeat protein
VIIADSGNHRLQVLNFDGTNFGFTQSITADFNGPTGVATYGTDHIIVADTGNNKIKMLDVNGTLLAEYTAPNDAYTGTFNRPRGVIGDCNGDIVVADTDNRRVVTIAGVLPLLSAFTASPTSGAAPLTVAFTNTSCGNYTESLWGFGDGVTSTLESPTHTYTAAGVYTVTLAVSGAGGSDTETKANYIAAWAEYVYLPLAMRNP